MSGFRNVLRGAAYVFVWTVSLTVTAAFLICCVIAVVFVLKLVT